MHVLGSIRRIGCHRVLEAPGTADPGRLEPSRGQPHLSPLSPLTTSCCDEHLFSQSIVALIVPVGSAPHDSPSPPTLLRTAHGVDRRQTPERAAGRRKTVRWARFGLSAGCTTVSCLSVVCANEGLL